MQPMASYSQEGNLMFVLLNLLIISSRSRFSGAGVGGWRCLVKSPRVVRLPLALLLVCGAPAEPSGFHFFPGCVAFVDFIYLFILI